MSSSLSQIHNDYLDPDRHLYPDEDDSLTLEEIAEELAENFPGLTIEIKRIPAPPFDPVEDYDEEPEKETPRWEIIFSTVDRIQKKLIAAATDNSITAAAYACWEEIVDTNKAEVERLRLLKQDPDVVEALKLQRKHPGY